MGFGGGSLGWREPSESYSYFSIFSFQLSTPSAPITSRVYFDINVQNQPLGRIVIGLYGSTTPKTCHNFETLCKGSASSNGQLLR